MVNTFVGAALLSAATVSVFGVERQAWACASCGSGSAAPLVLYPNERYKAYVGYSLASAFEVVTADQKIGTDNGPVKKETLTLALGARRGMFFGTISTPLLANSKGEEQEFLVADPLLSVYWVALAPDFTEPFVPQVQLSANYKHSVARSTYNSKSPANYIDVGGNGFNELSAQIDSWWAVTAYKFGLAALGTVPFEAEYNGRAVNRGNQIVTIVTTGYGFTDKHQVLFGWVRSQRAARESDGEVVQNSDELTQSLFLTGDIALPEGFALRLTMSHNGVLSPNKNSSRSVVYTTALTSSF